MAEQTVVTPNVPAGNIIDGSDRMWRTGDHILLSVNQGGTISGHYLKIVGSSVTTDGRNHENEVKLKVHLMLDKSFNRMVMLESAHTPGKVVAIDMANERVVAKQAPKKLNAYNTLQDVVKTNPEMVFYQRLKSRQSDLNYFESYLSDKRRILGFDDAGKPLDPTKVDPVKSEAHFRVLQRSSNV